MPIYEYLCEVCGLRFDRLQSFKDAPLQECPNCGGSVHRVIQPVGVIFKGSGFYVTDNRSKSSTMPPTKREGDKAGDSSSGSGSEPAAPSTTSTSSSNND
jgi:putative FmdB family regulatory protein